MKDIKFVSTPYIVYCIYQTEIQIISKFNMHTCMDGLTEHVIIFFLKWYNIEYVYKIKIVDIWYSVLLLAAEVAIVFNCSC